MRLFFGIIDQAGVNTFVIYNLIAANIIKDRINFSRELVLSIVKPHLQQRLALITI